MKRGRRSTASLNVIPININRARVIKPPVALTNAERDIFDDTARINTHLTAADATLLAAYAQAVCKSFRLVKRDDVSDWEKSNRIMLALARSLRLTQQAQTHPERAGRARANAAVHQPPWQEPEPPYSRDEIGDDD